MNPFSVYVVSAYSVRLVVMSPVISAAAKPNANVVTLNSPEAMLLTEPRTVTIR